MKKLLLFFSLLLITSNCAYAAHGTSAFGDGEDRSFSTLDISGELTTRKINRVIVVDGVRYPRTDAGIEQAVAALGPNGGQVFFPDGTYTASARIDVSLDKVTFQCASWNTKIVLGAAVNTVLLQVTGADFKMDRCYVDGNKFNNTTTATGIGFEAGGDNAVITNSFITATTGRCLNFKQVSGGRAQGNTFYDCGQSSGATNSRSSIGVDASPDVQILDNYIDSVWGSGILVDEESGVYSSRLLISRNNFTNMKVNQASAIHADRVDGIIITDNYIHDLDESATNGINAIFVGQAAGGNDERAIIRNNFIDNVTGVGIEMQGTGNILLDGNTMIFQTGGSDQQGIYISDDEDNVTIINNYIEGSANHGMVFNGDDSNIIITGNTVKNSQGGAAITFNPDGGETIDHVVIANNFLYDDQGVPTQTRGITKIGAGTLTDVRVLNNYMAGNTGGDTNGLPDSTVYGYSSLEISGKYTSTSTTDAGSTVQTSANQACNTTCTYGAFGGQDTGDANKPIVGPTDATADRCFCMGPN